MIEHGLLELVGQKGQSLIDILNQIERMGLLDSAQTWLTWRNLRSRLIHEYVENPEEFASALNTANLYAGELIAVAEHIHTWLQTLGLKEGWVG
ncbi:MAG: hypothetical protein A3J38_08280 [Gammaproteobacteria bacterium RIFCSPHIGHO2_12_FULL_45_9]|nr:MAG: hypothetical protein A3J38_08280 [Gammaproteobacteria bacterium RIFCSPHIGHO2_12_FULL_45_9]